MKHNLQISIRKKPSGGGIAYCRRVNVRERVLGWLLGEKKLVTVIVPGASVECMSIQALPEGGDEDGQNERTCSCG